MDEDMRGLLATAQRLAQSAYSNSDHALLKVDSLEKLLAEKDKRINEVFDRVFTEMKGIQDDVKEFIKESDKNWTEQRKLTMSNGEEQRRLIISTSKWVITGLITVLCVVIWGMIKP